MIIGLIIMVGKELGSEKIVSYARYYTDLYSLVVIYIIYNLFLFTLCGKPKSSRVINTISGTTFGIYLIHEHNLMMPFLFPVLLSPAPYIESWKFIPYSIVICLVVFATCCLIELIRQAVANTSFVRRITKWIDRIFECVMERVIGYLKCITSAFLSI